MVLARLARCLMLLAASPAWGAGPAVLDYRFFVERVQPIFLEVRTGSGRCYDCHSMDSNQSRFHLVPTEAGGTWNEDQSRRNFESVSTLIDREDPLKSRLLLHPLAASAGGDPFHSGGKFWKSKNDREWKILEAWARGTKLKATKRIR